MDEINPRLLRVSIEINGEFKVYEDLDIVVRGSKMANPLQNTCEVTITNLTRENRNYLLTETSPFNNSKRPKRIVVEAGRRGAGEQPASLSRVFLGEITSASPSQPPDIGLTLKAQTGAFSKGQLVARSGAAQQSLSSLAKAIAADLGLALDFQAQDKQIANYSFSGPNLRQVNALSLAGGVSVYVDDDALIVKDYDKPLLNRVRLLSASTGMVGIPEVTEQGVKVTYLLDNTSVLGGSLELESMLNPALNGRYTIYKLDFDLANRSAPFYYTAECKRPGFNPPKKAPV